ncbi:hypothetical protein [Polyangium sp. 6x1]|uniref:hypothetical protein n=1 Tax=Polyangium sp. 6x1 TaxID=3042689 RepID=UPI002482F7FB|nr:hypothetical protein [Polyangium sp. 6x1]MDI1443016.1 hypothetical protein [Polyangium sp. 6x1]
MKRAWLGAVALALVSGCGPSSPPSRAPAPASSSQPTPTHPGEINLDEETPPDAESTAAVQAMLQRVARARGLPIKRTVPGKVLDRDTMLRRIRETVEQDTPKDALVAQGELLAALDLVPADYDFVAGAFALLGGRVAGFYDPDDGAMYLADDLGEEEAQETLAHELAHALADQSFPLAPMVEYAPGAGDRLSAVHSVIEGDATSAMLDVTLGSAFQMSEEQVRFAFVASTAMSDIGQKTPRAITSSLVSPYTDGFAFIQALRSRGDWPAVDEVWRAMPETTEQLLHIDKLLAREPAEAVAPPVLGALGRQGYRALIDDVMGEQGLRILLEDVGSRAEARRGAAGWGGDRFVVAMRAEGPKRLFAVAFRLRMDTPADAAEVAELFERKYGKDCRERDKLGPVAWGARGRDIAFVAGPYERDGGTPRARGQCAEAVTWLGEVWQAAPPDEAGRARAGR